MKKLIFIVFTCISLGLFAQEHEVKLDVFDLTIFKALDITYQYNLNEESAVGLSIFKNLSDKDNIFNYREEFTITPYYRQYFPLGGMENVFIEGFFAINSGKDFIGDRTIEGVFEEAHEVDYTDGAFGFAIGKSFISNRGFILDLYAGLGRNLFESEGAPDLVPRLGINTGFRF